MKQYVITVIVTTCLAIFGPKGFAQETPPKLDRPPMEGEMQAPRNRQIPPGMILSPITILNLLCEDPELRDRTKITPRQIEELKTLINGLAQQQRAIRQKYAGRQLSKEDEAKQRKELVDLQNTLMPSVTKILDPEQMEQFYTTHYLILGGADSPLIGIEMFRFLKLSDEQSKKIDEILKKRIDEISGPLRKYQAENPGKQPTMEDNLKIRAQGLEIAKQYGEKIREVLTPEQRKIEEELHQSAPGLQGKLRQFLHRRMTPPTP